MEERNFAGRQSKGHRGAPGADFEVDLPHLLPHPPTLGRESMEEATGASAGQAHSPEAVDPRYWPAAPVLAAEVPPYGIPPIAVPPVSAGAESHGMAQGWGYDPARVWPSAVPEGPSGDRTAKGGGTGEPAEPVRKGASIGAAFGMALLAQFVLAGLALAVVWAFPREVGGLVKRVAGRMDVALPGRPALAGVPRGTSQADRLAILELEDRALFRAERSALEQLQQLSRELDPSDEGFDAVQASLIRVRQSLQLSQGELPGPLDPREILPGVETERDLPVMAIVDVLRNRRQSPAKRQRAAFLLAKERQSAAAQSALFHAIQDDPNLVVVRQSFQSFQELTGYPGRDFFDTDAIDRWWARNSASFMGQHTEKLTE